MKALKGASEHIVGDIHGNFPFDCSPLGDGETIMRVLRAPRSMRVILFGGRRRVLFECLGGCESGNVNILGNEVEFAP